MRIRIFLTREPGWRNTAPEHSTQLSAKSYQVSAKSSWRILIRSLMIPDTGCAAEVAQLKSEIRQPMFFTCALPLGQAT